MVPCFYMEQSTNSLVVKFLPSKQEPRIRFPVSASIFSSYSNSTSNFHLAKKEKKTIEPQFPRELKFLRLFS